MPEPEPILGEPRQGRSLASAIVTHRAARGRPLKDALYELVGCATAASQPTALLAGALLIAGAAATVLA